MDARELKQLLCAVAAGAVEPACAEAALKAALVRDGDSVENAASPSARPDLARGVRTGVSEVVFGEGKRAEQIADIVRALVSAGQQRVLITRLEAGKAAEVQNLLGCALQGESGGVSLELAAKSGLCDRGETADGLRANGPDEGGASPSVRRAAVTPLAIPLPCCGVSHGEAPAAAALGSDGSHVRAVSPLLYHEVARMGVVGGFPAPCGSGTILVASAGTSDEAVAEEAALTAEFLGNRVERLYDVGVAGIHRLLSHADSIVRARAIIAVAGMEGALPSVVAGLASCPVIAVPTSVGYGAAFGGVAALLAMLNSCASGVSVVNIDNGFGAGFQASLINHLPADGTPSATEASRASCALAEEEAATLGHTRVVRMQAEQTGTHV